MCAKALYLSFYLQQETEEERMSSTLTTLQLSAAARTAGASRGGGSGRSSRQLQAQFHRLHLQGLMGGGLGAAAEGRPSGRKEE